MDKGNTLSLTAPLRILNNSLYLATRFQWYKGIPNCISELLGEDVYEPCSRLHAERGFEIAFIILVLFTTDMRRILACDPWKLPINLPAYAQSAAMNRLRIQLLQMPGLRHGQCIPHMSEHLELRTASTCLEQRKETIPCW